MTAETAETAGAVCIRPMTAADVTEVAAMAKEFQGYLNALRNPGAASEPAALTEEALRRYGYGDDNWFSGLIAEREGMVVGYLLYYFGFSAVAAAGALVVADLFVREGHRNRGVGKALMADAARKLGQRGGKVFLWTVWDRNPAAIAFYQALGAETASDEIFMVWPSEAWSTMA